MQDPFDLQRFVTAQEPMLAIAITELQAGEKSTHWIWYIFPQMKGLGRSSMAQFYGIGSLKEAKAYLAHPVLGERLTGCTKAVLAHGDKTLHTIFGSPDDMKFISSMSLFALAAGEGASVFQRALDQWHQGKPDGKTLALAGNGSAQSFSPIRYDSTFEVPERDEEETTHKPMDTMRQMRETTYKIGGHE